MEPVRVSAKQVKYIGKGEIITHSGIWFLSSNLCAPWTCFFTKEKFKQISKTISACPSVWLPTTPKRLANQWHPVVSLFPAV